MGACKNRRMSRHDYPIRRLTEGPSNVLDRQIWPASLAPTFATSNAETAPVTDPGVRVSGSSDSLDRDLYPGDCPCPGTGRVGPDQLGPNMPFLQHNDLRQDLRATKVQGQWLCPDPILGEGNLGVRNANAGYGDSVRTGSHDCRGLAESNPWPIGRAVVGKEHRPRNVGQALVQLGVIARLHTQDSRVLRGT